MFYQCVHMNVENNWRSNLMLNYLGLSLVYEETGNFQPALKFRKQYHLLHDSLIGAETQGKIADLEAKYKVQQNELALQKSESKLAQARLSLERGVVLLALVLLLIGLGLWRWRRQTRQAKREKLENQHNLANLTHIMLEKNTRLLALEEQLIASSTTLPAATHSEGSVQNLYNRRILTEEDWSAFKVYFEKVYPGYIQRLKTTNPGLSDAEKRLFLFIKLELSRKEAAVMLGISVDSVKKTRNRLRHRLGLGEEVDLDAFVRAF